MVKKLLIVAGEESGDLHGSSLINELLKIDNNIKIYGIGGDKMSAAGMKVAFHINQMSFLGFVEILKHLPFIWKVKKELLKLVKQEKIKNVVLIDYPGFNLSFARSLNKIGIKPIYYISPQIWAWGKGRLKKIKKLISQMIVFFPFEEKLYSQNQVEAEFVGHPLAKKLDEYPFLSWEKLAEKFGLSYNKKMLLLLPGSRRQELDKILPILLVASKKLIYDFDLELVIACADNINEEYFEQYRNEIPFKLIKGRTYDLLKNATFAIVKSGTSTLEAGIIGTPFIVVYKTTFLTFLIGRLLVKIKNIALANIVAEENIVPELIQNDVNPHKIYKECNAILSNKSKLVDLKMGLRKVKNKLRTEGNPSKKAAEIIFAQLNV